MSKRFYKQRRKAVRQARERGGASAPTSRIMADSALLPTTLPAFQYNYPVVTKAAAPSVKVTIPKYLRPSVPAKDFRDMERLALMLSYKRPARSESEKEFIATYIDTLPGVIIDDYGNRIVGIDIETGDVPEPSRVLWSCHTDSVHRTPGRQLVDWNQPTEGEFILELGGKTPVECLGADNAAGCWLLINMIENKVPGLYVFHRDEESGANGSQWIADETPELLANIQYAIAFDRRGTTSVITKQRGDRCCSDAFATALGEELKLPYHLDPGGVFTDTASYTHLIPECTNVSVGTAHEHCWTETLLVNRVQNLLASLLEFDESTLVVARKCEPKPKRLASNWGGLWDDDMESAYGNYGSYDRSQYTGDEEELDAPRISPSGSDYQDILAYVKKNPYAVADYLEYMGVDLEEMRAYHSLLD